SESTISSSSTTEKLTPTKSIFDGIGAMAVIGGTLDPAESLLANKNLQQQFATNLATKYSLEELQNDADLAGIWEDSISKSTYEILQQAIALKQNSSENKDSEQETTTTSS